MNEDFYPVKFNAEQTEDIVFNGTTFKFMAAGNRGTHQLAMALLNNQFRILLLFSWWRISYDSPLPGYQESEEFHKIIPIHWRRSF